ncbi:hypothetical protein F2Q69_00057072 [Brassica cretica]|uniref:Uncharacterized protein n=1 Tax=Brassica cretica TaxID=69181 RepID=A0A8S9MND0_BRACR|nr:hypothetical protein F2Q69_00057072 [Brassica cretica]
MNGVVSDTVFGLLEDHIFISYNVGFFYVRESSQNFYHEIKRHPLWRFVALAYVNVSLSSSYYLGSPHHSSCLPV